MTELSLFPKNPFLSLKGLCYSVHQEDEARIAKLSDRAIVERAQLRVEFSVQLGKLRLWKYFICLVWYIFKQLCLQKGSPLEEESKF